MMLYPFPGPDADMTRPDAQAVLNAEISLKLAQDAQARGEARGITPENAALLLHHIVAEQRHYVAEKHGYGGARAFAKTTNLGHGCGISASLTMLIGRDLAASVRPLQFQDLGMTAPENILRHSASIVALPVEENGHTQVRHFLVDTTYRQFCAPMKPRVIGNCEIYQHKPFTNPGYVLASTQEGRAMLDALLAKGYIELDEEKAALYAASLSNGKRAERSYLEAMLEKAKPITFNERELRRVENPPSTPLQKFLKDNAKTARDEGQANSHERGR
jgi:hypothetical protein